MVSSLRRNLRKQYNLQTLKSKNTESFYTDITPTKENKSIFNRLLEMRLFAYNPEQLQNLRTEISSIRMSSSNSICDSDKDLFKVLTGPQNELKDEDGATVMKLQRCKNDEWWDSPNQIDSSSTGCHTPEERGREKDK